MPSLRPITLPTRRLYALPRSSRPNPPPDAIGFYFGELIVLHLDPDLYLDWRSWLEDFRESILPDTTRSNLGNAFCTFYI